MMVNRIARNVAAVIASGILIASMSACSDDSSAVTTAACKILTPAADSINATAHNALDALAENPESAAQGLTSATETVKNAQEKLPTNLRTKVNDVVAVLEDLTELSQKASDGADLSPERIAEFGTRIDDATVAMVDFCS